MRYRTQAITVAKLEGRREEVLNPFTPPPPTIQTRGGFLITCLTPTFSPNDRIAYYNSTDVFFSNGGGGGGGWERGELAGVSWEVILDPQLKILKSALHELCRLWQVLYLLLLPAVPKVSC